MKVVGRGELQLSILIEMMRREGFELQVSRPEIVTKEIDGKTIEPVEELVIDVPEDLPGRRHRAGRRRARGMMTKMVNHGSGRVRLEFRIPARGLIGFRSQFLTDTKGTGIMNHIFVELGAVARRDPVARRPARWSPTAPASRPPTRSSTCRSAARSSSSPATQVYEGMIIGENARAERHGRQRHARKRSRRTCAPRRADEAIRLIPPRKLGLEQAIEFINDDELVEVTPTEHPPAQAHPRGEHAAEDARRVATRPAAAALYSLRGASPLGLPHTLPPSRDALRRDLAEALA